MNATSVTRKKSPNVYKSCHKMISLEERFGQINSCQRLLKTCPKSNKSPNLVTLTATMKVNDRSTKIYFSFKAKKTPASKHWQQKRLSNYLQSVFFFFDVFIKRNHHRCLKPKSRNEDRVGAMPFPGKDDVNGTKLFLSEKTIATNFFATKKAKHCSQSLRQIIPSSVHLLSSIILFLTKESFVVEWI